MNSNAPARMTAALEMARERLQLETLETRNSDRLDFHALDVASIRDCVQIAFDEGYAAGVESRERTAALSLSDSSLAIIRDALKARAKAILDARDNSMILDHDTAVELHLRTWSLLGEIETALDEINGRI